MFNNLLNLCQVQVKKIMELFLHTFKLQGYDTGAGLKSYHQMVFSFNLGDDLPTVQKFCIKTLHSLMNWINYLFAA